MIKINAIELAAGIATDVNEEINELDELIAADTKKATEIRKKYNHISSLLVGMSYVIDYTEEEEERHDLQKIIEDLRSTLNTYRRQCMEIIYSAQCGREVRIQRDTPDTFALTIKGNGIAEAQAVINLKDLDAVKEAFFKLAC